MENKEIVEKAVQKAVDGGWKYKGVSNYHYDSLKSYNDFWVTINFKETTVVENYETGEDETVPITTSMRPVEMIFNHDFAKALWGEITIVSHSANSLGQHGSWHMPAWQYHLQQMVIADDPIKYIGDNI